MIDLVNGMMPSPLLVSWRRQDGVYTWAVDVRNKTFYKGPRQGTYGQLDQLKGATFVHVGDVPRGSKWNAFLRSSKQPAAIQVEDSPNVTTDQLVGATELASVPWRPEATVIFNALPYEKGLPRQQIELRRMGVSSNREAWQELTNRIGKIQNVSIAASYSQATATRENLLRELAGGTSNVLLIYMHFDGQDLYLPGMRGGKIGIEDIEDIQRPPHNATRVIVLASCNGALDAAESGSLAAVLLKNGLARTVMATDELYSAQNIPTLLGDLLSGKSIRSSTPGLQQYVTLRPMVLAPNRPGDDDGE